MCPWLCCSSSSASRGRHLPHTSCLLWVPWAARPLHKGRVLSLFREPKRVSDLKIVSSVSSFPFFPRFLQAHLRPSDSDRNPASLSSHRCFSLSWRTNDPYPQLAASPESQDPTASHTCRWGDGSHQPLYTGGNHWQQRLPRWRVSAQGTWGSRKQLASAKNPPCKGPEGSSSEGSRLETPLTFLTQLSKYLSHK